MQATFVSGDPIFVDYTPSGSAVSAGDVIVVDNYTYIAHSDIAVGEKGAVAAGGGVYEMTGDANISAGDKVHWDSSTEKFTISTDSSANKSLGNLLPQSSCSADGQKALVLHRPDGSAI